MRICQIRNTPARFTCTYRTLIPESLWTSWFVHLKNCLKGIHNVIYLIEKQLFCIKQKWLNPCILILVFICLAIWLLMIRRTLDHVCRRCSAWTAVAGLELIDSVQVFLCTCADSVPKVPLVRLSRTLQYWRELCQRLSHYQSRGPASNIRLFKPPDCHNLLPNILVYSKRNGSFYWWDWAFLLRDLVLAWNSPRSRRL